MYDRLTISRLSDWDSSSDVSWLDSEAVPEPVRDVHDAVIASDIHLGSSNCQAKAFCCLLESIVEGTLPTLRLVLNGDVFDSFDFRRLRKSHWKVLSLLRKLSDQIEIVWICGNHDGSAEVFSNLLGVEVTDEFIFQSGSRRVIALHGHTFDDFIDVHPILTWFGDCIYALLQSIDSSHTMARMAKHGSKTFVRCAKKIRNGAIEHARKRRCDVVVCGHTHFATMDDPVRSGIQYINSGCWTESPSTYLTVSNGWIEMHCLETMQLEMEEVASIRCEKVS